MNTHVDDTRTDGLIHESCLMIDWKLVLVARMVSDSVWRVSTACNFIECFCFHARTLGIHQEEDSFIDT